MTFEQWYDQNENAIRDDTKPNHDEVKAWLRRAFNTGRKPIHSQPILMGCQSCAGTGHKTNGPCIYCGGTGSVMEHSQATPEPDDEPDPKSAEKLTVICKQCGDTGKYGSGPCLYCQPDESDE